MKRRPIVTVDLDSTLCDTGHRHHLIDRENGTDWVAYSMACKDDTVVEATARLVRILSVTHDVHYVSGRDVEAHDLTCEWIESNLLPKDGVWLQHREVEGEHHADYKLRRIREVEEATGQTVVLHLDDWELVKVRLEQDGIPTICVRTPQEVSALLQQDLEKEHI